MGHRLVQLGFHCHFYLWWTSWRLELQRPMSERRVLFLLCVRCHCNCQEGKRGSVVWVQQKLVMTAKAWQNTIHENERRQKRVIELMTKSNIDSNVPIDFEVDVGDASIRKIVITMNGETQILSRDNHVVMLDDDIVGKWAGIDLLDITHDIMERHGDLKVKSVGDVIHTRVGLGFGINFSIEQLGGPNLSNHFSCSAKDGHFKRTNSR